MASPKLISSIVVGAAVLVAGGSYGIVSATSSSPAAASAGSAAASGGVGSNARSGPAQGGASGTVARVSTSSFTLSTAAGQKVTVKEGTATTYEKGTRPASASAVTTGQPVLVLGTTSGTTITATQVIVQPTSAGSAASSAANVVPFQRGAPTTAKQVGQTPANWTQGSGTIITGTAANNATEAALAAYPGGIVDRVVKLSNGEYNVHYIGVNWPHHVFVNQDFKVVGAE
jgi:preprotein translocase subunit YajC